VLTLVFAAAAAFAYFAYMANGLVVGALIGLPGREADIAVAQGHAAKWLVAFAALQAGVVTGLFSLLRFGADATPVVRFASRAVVATLLSFPATLTVGALAVSVVKLLSPHLR
jgi:hypothetical protein